MIKQLLCIGLCLMLFGCQQKSDLPGSIDINSGWVFKSEKNSAWLKAEVPGNVHSDLLENARIEDPFIGGNELELQWVSETDWEYKTQFIVSEALLLKKHLELSFEGLDTYASVFLNDSLILNTNNAFRSFKVDVKSILKLENEMRIVFQSGKEIEDGEKAKLGYELPEGNRIFTRKAQFQYGWDWGPKLNTSGIWRTITLTGWNDLIIEDVFVKQIALNDSIANLVAEIDFHSDFNEDLTLDVFVNTHLNVSKPIVVNRSKVSIPFQIENPEKWWPHNLGAPYLYDLKFVVKQGRTVLDSFRLNKGLRTIELVTEKDSIGESFYFKVNNLPVYAKGANYIPQNSMQNKVTCRHYEKLLSDVVDANMNMLRVWGGGIYENDVFYNLCDEKGILVWQDFMFACAMYPGDKMFLNNVKQEAVDNLKRLRNHSSIALWCGNNENSEGWKRWGWQADKTEDQKIEIWNDYLKVFDSILPETVKQLTDKASYWGSSPKYGRGNEKYKTEGDAHDWWVWHDGYPFEHLEENVPRFMSEFGFQSFPSYEAIKFINQSDSVSIASDGFQSHQKHSRGFDLIKEYMARDFPVPSNDEDYVYVSHLLQAYGITKGIRAQRQAKPYNMGTLYWQLNDCWPVVSWSSIDFFGNWKALHYEAKNAFENVLITSKVENDTLTTYIINDSFKSEKGELKIQISDFNGNNIWEDSKEIEVASNSSEIKYELNLSALQLNKNEVVIASTFNKAKEYFYLVKPKGLKLKQEVIHKTISKTETGFDVILSSKTLQKNVFLYSNSKGHFSDNYFDLMPNESRRIHFKTKVEVLDAIKLKTLNKLIQQEGKELEVNN